MTDVAAATGGDESAFARLVERHQRELRVHCYRMLGSFDDAEDLVQETFLRAWRRRSTFAGRSSFRAWLYGIATNACLDALAQRPRRLPSRPGVAGPAEIPWLQPFPDSLLDASAPGGEEPEAVLVERETIELAFVVAIQHLPPRQRAALIVRDLLGWSANETAALLEVSVAAANSALQRARATLKEHLPARRSEWTRPSRQSEEERALLERYMEAHDRGDAAALAELLREDARLTMPPQPELYLGREAISDLLARYAFGPESPGHFRLVPTRANRQPAAANYVRAPGDTRYRALSLDVLRIEEGAITEITAFEPRLFAAFGLPPAL